MMAITRAMITTVAANSHTKLAICVYDSLHHRAGVYTWIQVAIVSKSAQFLCPSKTLKYKMVVQTNACLQLLLLSFALEMSILPIYDFAKITTENTISVQL